MDIRLISQFDCTFSLKRRDYLVHSIYSACHARNGFKHLAFLDTDSAHIANYD